MRIVNEDLLAEFRLPGRCELCQKWCRLREPHHAFARGMGGASRLDVRYNLISLGSGGLFLCDCHRRAHDGKVKRDKILAVIARREGTTPAAVLATLYALLRRPGR